MEIITLTSKNFEQEVMQSNKPVLIDFWAGWCGPCRMLSPIVDEVAKEVGGKIKVGKVNIDEQQEIAKGFEVMSIPTLVLIEHGKVKNTLVGVRSKSEILEMVQ